MALKGHTTKPCDGCGATGGRTAGQLCWRCQQLMAEAKAARAKQAEPRVEQVYRLPGAIHGHPSYYVQRLVSGSRDQVDRDAVRNRLMELAVLLGEPILGSPPYNPPAPLAMDRMADRITDWRTPHAAKHVYLDPAVAQALDALDKAIEHALETTYLAGRHDGADLLSGLAAGTVDPATFNKKTVLQDPRAVVAPKQYVED